MSGVCSSVAGKVPRMFVETLLALLRRPVCASVLTKHFDFLDGLSVSCQRHTCRRAFVGVGTAR